MLEVGGGAVAFVGGLKAFGVGGGGINGAVAGLHS